MIEKLKKLSLSKKLFAFVGLASFLVLAVSGAGSFYYSRIETANLLKDDVNTIVEKVLTARVIEKTYLQFFSPEMKKQFNEKTQDVKTHVINLKAKKIDNAWMTYINTIGSEFEEYRKLFDEIVEIHVQEAILKIEMVKPIQKSEGLLMAIISDILKKQQELRMDGEELSPADAGMLNIVRDCRTSFLQLQTLQLQFLASGDEKYLNEYNKVASGDLREFLMAFEQVATATKNNVFISSASTVKESLTKFADFIKQSKELYEKEIRTSGLLNETGQQIIGAANALLSQVDKTVTIQKGLAVTFISALLVIGILLFFILSFFLIRSITKPIKSVIEGLTESAEQVASGSIQVSSASQQLAEGASEQAASIEETSASLEEISSMTKQNADSAEQANKLMTDAKHTITETNHSMKRLTSSMGEITRASEETQKIIKTIDEIAFQTNLLALNAAVEAARAGEAGAGFAVVADEVRNLSKRAAEAAKNTSVLIETTVKTIKEGAGLVESTNSEFGRVLESASKVEQLVGEIAAASREQSLGIDQVNNAVAEMDKVTQQNAANAEESASASAEMNSRAEEMKAFVDDLSALVGGSQKQVSYKQRDYEKDSKPKALAFNAPRALTQLKIKMLGK